MSRITLSGNASGTGNFTLASPNSNTDRTLTLPDATGTVNVSGLANEVPAGSAGAPAIYPTGDTNTGIFFPAADTVAVATGGAERMRVDSSGNVGIGTTTPNSKLTVNGNILAPWSNSGTYEIGVEQAPTNVFASTSNVFVVRGADATTSGASAMGGGSLLIRAGRSYGGAAGPAGNVTIQGGETTGGTPGAILFSVGSTAQERARIDSSGNLLVGTTSAYGTGVTLRSNATSEFTAPGVTGTSSVLNIVSNLNPAVQMRGNGGIANYSANNVNLSDRREKTDIEPAGSYLDKICAIPVVTFNYLHQSEEDPGKTLGVLAQDVQTVAPELVTESNWGPQDEPKLRLSIYQTDLQYALMKAIQELKAEVDSLKAQLEAN